MFHEHGIRSQEHMMETAMNDKADVFVRRFRVGEHTVIMTMSRRKFRRACRPGSPRKKSASIAVAAMP